MDGSNNQEDDPMDSDIEEDSDDDEDNKHHFYYGRLTKDTLQRLKQNDPSFTDLLINLHRGGDHRKQGECSIVNIIDWKKDGDCIVNNTKLKKLHITYDGIEIPPRPSYKPYSLGDEGPHLPTREQLKNFFSCIYRNKSIEYISIDSISFSFDHDDFGAGLIGGLGGHHSLKRLEIRRGRSLGCTAFGKILKQHQSKLKQLCLPSCHLDDLSGERIQCLSDALLGNSTIKKLCLDDNRISAIRLRDISTVLQHPNCKLTEISLSYDCINDEGSNILGSALRGTTVRKLGLLDNHRISSEGWQTLLNHLPQSSIDSLVLSRNGIDNNALAALASIRTLKSLDLTSNRSITPTGWRSFFNSLQMNGTQFNKLVLSYNDIGNECIDSLCSLLINMSSLKTLDMDSMYSSHDSIGVTPQEWQAFFTALHDSNLDLKRFSLSHINIDDNGMQLLVQLVSSMQSLKYLSLESNRRVTPAGWQALTGLIQDPNFVLRELNLNENNINDDNIVAFASALTHNKTLKRLCLDGTYDEETDEHNSLITERGWEAVSSLLCDKTSIMNTYTSNHTLQHVGDYSDPWFTSGDVTSYLDLNEKKDKAEVARQKILKYHFSNSDTSKIQEFLDKEIEVIPSAIAWMGRPTHADWNGIGTPIPMGRKGAPIPGLSLMFNLTRRMPDLFDSSAQKKPGEAKRKRGITSGLDS